MCWRMCLLLPHQFNLRYLLFAFRWRESLAVGLFCLFVSALPLRKDRFQKGRKEVIWFRHESCQCPHWLSNVFLLLAHWFQHGVTGGRTETKKKFCCHIPCAYKNISSQPLIVASPSQICPNKPQLLVLQTENKSPSVQEGCDQQTVFRMTPLWLSCEHAESSTNDINRKHSLHLHLLVVIDRGDNFTSSRLCWFFSSIVIQWVADTLMGGVIFNQMCIVVFIPDF